MDPATLAAIIDGANIVIENAVRAAQQARARGEWTDEQVAEFKAKVEAVKVARHWQIDPDPAAPSAPVEIPIKGQQPTAS